MNSVLLSFLLSEIGHSKTVSLDAPSHILSPTSFDIEIPVCPAKMA